MIAIQELRFRSFSPGAVIFPPPKSGGHDADDDVGVAVKIGDLANDLAISAERFRFAQTITGPATDQ